MWIKPPKNIIYIRSILWAQVPTRMYRIMYPILITWNKSNVKKVLLPVKNVPETQELLHSLRSTQISLGCPEIDGKFLPAFFTVSEYALTLFMESSYSIPSQFLLLPSYLTLLKARIHLLSSFIYSFRQIDKHLGSIPPQEEILTHESDFSQDYNLRT